MRTLHAPNRCAQWGAVATLLALVLTGCCEPPQLQGYTPNPVCPKCESPHVIPAHMWGSCGEERIEWLHWYCSRCGYGWNTKTCDARIEEER